MSHDDAMEAMSLAMLPSADREIAQQYRSDSFDAFFNDLRQMSPKEAENILLVMSGYDEYVQYKDHKALQDKGWVFVPDMHDLDNLDKYGYDANGNPRMGCKVESPNHLFSVSVADIKRFLNSQDLYSEFFAKLFKKE